MHAVCSVFKEALSIFDSRNYILLNQSEMKLTKYIISLLIITIWTSCEVNNKESSKFNVEHKGALKNMMHKGDLSAKADLNDFKNAKHFYAIGAIENLKGEIQIFDSKSFNSMVIDNALIFDSSFNKKAALLVYASISSWKSIDIPDSILTYEHLESFIRKSAETNQIKIEEPFPFLIHGTPKSFDWHVINWKDRDSVHTHEKHVNSGLHGTATKRQAEMLGFYSDSHHAIFTHHTTNMHIHIKTVDNKIAGHLDGLTLGKGMILKLPNTKQASSL
jgi:acetolactate decarboxylase